MASEPLNLAKNPANVVKAENAAARKRIPMSTPQLKLQVPEIPGYHLHWFVNHRIARALQGGYEFVDDKEVSLNNRGVASDTTLTGNADLGSRVRVVTGVGTGGQPEYLTLMKVKEEFWLEDQKAHQARNREISDAIYKSKEGLATSEDRTGDRSLKYTKNVSVRYQPK